MRRKENILKVCSSGTESNRILIKYEKEIKGRIEGKEYIVKEKEKDELGNNISKR